MNSHDVKIVNCGSALHLADVRELEGRHLAIPHDHSAWPLHCTVGSWLWCRVVDPAGILVTGFAIQLTSSRALPWTRIGQIERLGRELHAELADVMGAVLSEAARKIPRLLRLDVRVFDEDATRRHTLSNSLRTAGWVPTPRRRQYSNTLVLKLALTESEVLKGFSTRVRSTIKKALNSPALRFAPIIGTQYAERIRYLYTLPFARTGGVPAPIDIEGILLDAASGHSSLLIGAFACEVQAPEDLVALVWGRLHGDHAVLEINASERSQLFSNLSPGFGLMAQLIAWAIQHGAQWIDMGGITSMEPAPDDPMRGIVEFKTRFTTDLREVAEEWHLEPSPLLARTAAAVRSVARSVGGMRQLSAVPK